MIFFDTKNLIQNSFSLRQCVKRKQKQLNFLASNTAQEQIGQKKVLRKKYGFNPHVHVSKDTAKLRMGLVISDGFLKWWISELQEGNFILIHWPNFFSRKS